MVGSKDGKVIQENKDIGSSIRETPRSQGFKNYLCSTQLNIKVILLINFKNVNNLTLFFYYEFN